jgi:hypothetical protein
MEITVCAVVDETERWHVVIPVVGGAKSLFAQFQTHRTRVRPLTYIGPDGLRRVASFTEPEPALHLCTSSGNHLEEWDGKDFPLDVYLPVNFHRGCLPAGFVEVDRDEAYVTLARASTPHRTAKYPLDPDTLVLAPAAYERWHDGPGPSKERRMSAMEVRMRVLTTFPPPEGS